MCVYKNHAFIFHGRPPKWSGTWTIPSRRYLWLLIAFQIEFEVPVQIFKTGGRSTCKRNTELMENDDFRLFAAMKNGKCKRPFVRCKRKRHTFGCLLQIETKKWKFVFLGRKTINGNQWLLFQQTCDLCPVTTTAFFSQGSGVGGGGGRTSIWPRRWSSQWQSPLPSRR